MSRTFTAEITAGPGMESYPDADGMIVLTLTVKAASLMVTTPMNGAGIYIRSPSGDVEGVIRGNVTITDHRLTREADKP